MVFIDFSHITFNICKTKNVAKSCFFRSYVCYALAACSQTLPRRLPGLRGLDFGGGRRPFGRSGTRLGPSGESPGLSRSVPGTLLGIPWMPCGAPSTNLGSLGRLRTQLLMVLGGQMSSQSVLTSMGFTVHAFSACTKPHSSLLQLFVPSCSTAVRAQHMEF